MSVILRWIRFGLPTLQAFVTSPYSSGSGGSFFVATVVLAAMLCEMPARGTLSAGVTHVQAQRGDFAAPLDDIVVACVRWSCVITIPADHDQFAGQG